MGAIVRPLKTQDKAAWDELWLGYLTFYENTDLVSKVTDNTWDMISGPREDVFCLVAEVNGKVVGFVHCVLHANTWSDKPVCYLQDLFVNPSERGQGAGQALIESINERMKTENWHRVYWRTASDNATAQALYDKLATRTGWVTYEVNL